MIPEWAEKVVLLFSYLFKIYPYLLSDEDRSANAAFAGFVIVRCYRHF